MIEQIVENIKWICDKNNVPVPNIFTEFGSYTVGESARFCTHSSIRNFKTTRSYGT
jgi:hypothetical protein